jgi:hypothetical protein
MSYGKARITRVDPVDIGNPSRELVYKALYASWGPESVTDIDESITKDKLRERLTELDRKPRGIVITNIGDMEFPGGLALAAGHKQLLDFYQSNWPFNDSVITSKMSITIEEKEKVRRAVYDIIRAWGYAFVGLDDDIDYITLALDIQPGTYGPGFKVKKMVGGYSLDDAINRLSPDGVIPGKDGKPLGPPNVYAYVGRLVEADSGMALYQAMCSLFCPMERAFYFDWWPEKWGKPCKAAAPIMKKKLKVTIYHESGVVKANIESWRYEMRKGNQKHDFIHVSAAGGYDNWRAGKLDDIPESKPVVVYFAHSGGSRNPKNNDTIIGRWLRNGAYITYGAITEPFAASFNTSRTVAESIVKGVPFGRAFQQKETLSPAYRRPWKLIYVGDPLRELEPECRQTR